MLLPLVIWLRRAQPAPWSQFLSRCMLGCGLAGIVLVGLHEALTWLPSTGVWGREYFLHRWAFVVVTLTDLPLLPLTLYGGMLILLPPKMTRAEVIPAPPPLLESSATVFYKTAQSDKLAH